MPAGDPAELWSGQESDVVQPLSFVRPVFLEDYCDGGLYREIVGAIWLCISSSNSDSNLVPFMEGRQTIVLPVHIVIVEGKAG